MWRHCRARSAPAAPTASQRSPGGSRQAEKIGFLDCLCGRRAARSPRMNDAVFGAVAERPSDALLRQTIRHRVEAAGTSFYWAMRLLPKHRRNAMYAIYAFCREVDDIADGERPVEYKIAALAAWREEIDALYAGHPRHVIAKALSKPAVLYDLCRRDFLAII